MKKKTEIRACLAVAPQAVKGSATERGKCLVKMEKAFNLWVEHQQRMCARLWQRAEPMQRLLQGTLYCSGDTKPFAASKGRSHRFSNRLD